eukprot:7025024-Pyramimonas_sp.AAC.1
MPRSARGSSMVSWSARAARRGPRVVSEAGSCIMYVDLFSPCGAAAVEAQCGPRGERRPLAAPLGRACLGWRCAPGGPSVPLFLSSPAA